MSDELYACVCAAEFPAQALLRLRTELQSEPVAVLEGRAPLETVCSLNRAAHLKGAVLGMTRLEAEGIAGLRLLARSVEVEAAARSRVAGMCRRTSPRALKRRATATTCAFVLDIAGTGLLFGPPEILAQRLRAALTCSWFPRFDCCERELSYRTIEGRNLTRHYRDSRRAGSNCACKAPACRVESRREPRGDLCYLGDSHAGRTGRAA